jgi:DNA (cytosine-5)-methyltransferase 1
MKRRYVSLFSGAGGLDIGLEMAGFEPFSMCEVEKVFCKTLAENQGWQHNDGRIYFKNAKIINADIRELTHADFATGTELDLLVGGPPCQAFSSSGKQLSVLDPRGALVSQFVRVVDALKPRMFLFENVRGLVTARDRFGEPGGVITELIHILEETGYSCRAGLLNSADYGAYQRRVRCFIIGSRNGTAPNFPEPQFQKGTGLFHARWRSLKDFLDVFADEDVANHTYPSPTLNEQLIGIRDGSGVKSPGRAEATRPSGHWGYRQGTFIADLSLPARTVTGSGSQDWVRWNGKLRRLTINEVKLLQCFPSDWVVCGTRAQQYKQVGNAVPSVFGVAIGGVIAEHLSCFPSTRPVRIELPKEFQGYIEYTKRDHLRNRDSRSVHRNFENSD